MGLNMPAKTVVFTAVKKWDGDSNRYIGSGEYIQVSDVFLFLGSGGLIHSTGVSQFLLNTNDMVPLDEWKGWASWQR